MLYCFPEDCSTFYCKILHFPSFADIGPFKVYVMSTANSLRKKLLLEESGKTPGGPLYQPHLKSSDWNKYKHLSNTNNVDNSIC